MSGAGDQPKIRDASTPLGDDQALMHELRVHQIELEIQNEELRRAHIDVEKSRSRYFETYDLAPVGLCTVDAEGGVVESNLTLATMLGKRRGFVDAQPFARQVVQEDRDILYLMQRRLFERGVPVSSCELRLTAHDGASFWVRLDGVMARDDTGAPVCRLSVSDISRERSTTDAQRVLMDAHIAALDAVPSCVAVLDAAGVVILLNLAWRRRAARRANRDAVGLHHVVAWGVPTESPFGHDAAAVLAAIGAALAGDAGGRVACDAYEGGAQGIVRVQLASGAHARVVVTLDESG